MTPKDATNFLRMSKEVQEGYAAGKVIQILTDFLGQWKDLKSASFNLPAERYRVKPEPPKPIEVWLPQFTDSDGSRQLKRGSAYPSKKICDDWWSIHPGYIGAVKFVQYDFVEEED